MSSKLTYDDYTQVQGGPGVTIDGTIVSCVFRRCGSPISRCASPISGMWITGLGEVTRSSERSDDALSVPSLRCRDGEYRRKCLWTVWAPSAASKRCGKRAFADAPVSLSVCARFPCRGTIHRPPGFGATVARVAGALVGVGARRGAVVVAPVLMSSPAGGCPARHASVASSGPSARCGVRRGGGGRRWRRPGWGHRSQDAAHPCEPARSATALRKRPRTDVCSAWSSAFSDRSEPTRVHFDADLDDR